MLPLFLLKTVKKQILKYGEWVHPSDEKKKLVIDRSFVDRLVENFKRSPFAPIFRGHVSRKSAEENPSLIVNKNIKDLEIDDEGLNAVMDIDESDLSKYNDVSCGISPDGRDNVSGQKIGPVLKHIALTLDPYIKNLNPFVSLKDMDGEDMLVNLSEISDMAKKKTNAEATEDVAVEAVLSESAETEETAKEEVVEVVESKSEANDPKVESTDIPTEVKAEDSPETEAKPEVGIEETKETDVDEANEGKEPLTADELSEVERLKAKILELEEKDAERSRQMLLQESEMKYKELLQAGKIVPAMKSAYIKLAQASETVIELSDGEESIGVLLSEMFEKAPKLIHLEEEGVDVESEADPKEVKIKAALRERHPDKTDEEFEDWYSKNQAIIKDAEKI